MNRGDPSHIATNELCSTHRTSSTRGVTWASNSLCSQRRREGYASQRGKPQWRLGLNLLGQNASSKSSVVWIAVVFTELQKDKSSLVTLLC